MNAADVIKEAAALGIQIAIEGDGLSLEATAQPPKAIIELITQHKPEIINLLRPGRGGPAKVRVSWLDMEVAVDNEAGRHRIWRAGDSGRRR
jgi:tubulysin polyketide synthase-like protein